MRVHCSLLLVLVLILISSSTEAATVETFAALPANFEDISVGPDETLYVPSSPAGGVAFHLDLDGTLTTLSTNLHGPLGGVVDSNGNYYVSCFNAHHIEKIEPDGTRSIIATGVITPTGLLLSPDEQTLYASSYNPGQLVRIDIDSGDQTVIANGASILGPDGLAMDEAGNIYVANFVTSQITKVDPDGNESVLVTLPGSQTGYIDYRAGFLYVAGLDTHKIYLVSVVDGSYSTLAGTGVPGTTEGPAETARINNPNGLALSKDGKTLWFQTQNLMRRVLLDDATGIEDSVPEFASDPDADPASTVRVSSLAPNPFRESVRITLSAGEATPASVSIFDVSGRIVRTLTSAVIVKGEQALNWDGLDSRGRSVDDGVYFVRSSTVDGVSSRRVVRIRN